MNSKKNKRVTIVDVAKLAKVSNSTASRVFDKKWDGLIKDETRQAVLDAAKSLGYLGTSALVRGLQRGRTNMVALVVGRTTGYFYLEVIMKFVRVLHATGRQVLIFEADPEKELENIVVQAHQYQVDAIIVTAAATSSSIINSFCDVSVPVIAFNRQVENSNISAVYCDGHAAACKVADFLMDNGHQTFMVISGNANVSKELGRIEGFCKRVEKRGGEILQIASGDYTYESGYAIASELLSIEKPDAFFCAEDTIAMGAIDAARGVFGLRIPEDLSVMGFDNTSVSRFKAYSLTTVEHPIMSMIEGTVDMMAKLLENPAKQMERIYDMRIVTRNSVKVTFPPQ